MNYGEARARCLADLQRAANGYAVPGAGLAIDKARGDARYAEVDYGRDEGRSAFVRIEKDGRIVYDSEIGAAEPAAYTDRRKDGMDAERTRILALLHEMRPCDEPFTRPRWEWERLAEKKLYEKIIAAITGPQEQKGGD